MKTSPILSLSTPRFRRNADGGFTILELLISVIIISILVAIIIPVLSNRAADARIAAARSDLEAIKTAQEHAAIDTGYFYRLYVLDDVRGGDGISPKVANDVVDGILDEELRGGSEWPRIFVDVQNGDLLSQSAAQNKFDTLKQSETNFNWNGPYVNYVKKVAPNEPPAALIGRTAGIPVDPYGNAYLLFTKEGLVREPEGDVVPTVDVGGQSYNAKIFDRPTILSLGADGSPGTGANPADLDNGQFGQGDDMFRQF